MDAQSQVKLQMQSFEAINEVVRSASHDTVPLVAQLIPLFLSKLAAALGAPSPLDAGDRTSELQASKP